MPADGAVVDGDVDGMVTVPDGGDGGPRVDLGDVADAGGCAPGACLAVACSCTVGTDCCSGSCDGVCVPAGCGLQGSACTVNEDCCTLFCSPAGTCAPTPPLCRGVGLACTTTGDCCSGNCANPAGATCPAGALDCICGASTGCHAGGEACTSDGQCCNGLCD